MQLTAIISAAVVLATALVAVVMLRDVAPPAGRESAAAKV